MKISNSLKYLVTNYHNINPDKVIEDIEIEISNNKKMKLNLEDRNIKYFKPPKDITVIEIKYNDSLYGDIEFLDYDNNYKKNGYKIYKNIDVFSIEHPFGKAAVCASGTITHISNYELYHNISTDVGSSGSPIILLNNNINSIQVIGIHKNSDNNKKINGGTFIGEIIDEITNDSNHENLMGNDNYIIAEIFIEKKYVNKDIRIINSYEECMRNNFNVNEINEDDLIRGEMNEAEIKNCEISINEELIPFSYIHKFKEEGKYIIKYSFWNKLTKTNCLFSHCFLLKQINLSNFDSINVTNMMGMFEKCSDLEFINFSNFNSYKVTNMSNMFKCCYKLKEIKGINDFYTKIVTHMNSMFQECKKLEYIDLSNFNNSKIKDMGKMFFRCEELKEIKGFENLNRENAFNIHEMFTGCDKLELSPPLLPLPSPYSKDEETIAVIFKSLDQGIDYPIACKSSDIFKDVKEKLFLEYPELKDKSFACLANGRPMDDLYTVEENGIKNGNIILIILM